MAMHGKIIAILIVLCSLLLYPSISVCAQRFGITPPQPQQKVLSAASGRFVFGQISDSSKDQFMLDTFTGRLWRITQRSDVGTCLTSIPYRDAEGKCSALPEKVSDPGYGEAKNQ